MDREACNALLLKVNQIGTLSEALAAYRLARAAAWQVVISVRSGDTEDNWFSDLAVGWSGDQTKAGSLTHPNGWRNTIACWPSRPNSPCRFTAGPSRNFLYGCPTYSWFNDSPRNTTPFSDQHPQFHFRKACLLSDSHSSRRMSMKHACLKTRLAVAVVGIILMSAFSAPAADKPVQTPEQAWQRLKDGNERFAATGRKSRMSAPPDETN